MWKHTDKDPDHKQLNKEPLMLTLLRRFRLIQLVFFIKLVHPPSGSHLLLYTNTLFFPLRQARVYDIFIPD